MQKLALTRELSWSPDASFRERDQDLGPEFAVSVFAPDGTLTQLPLGVLRVLAAFGSGATAAQVCDRLGLADTDVPAVTELAGALVARRFLTPADASPSDRESVMPAAFLVTAHGCGGTLLRLFLDAHERVACAPPHRLGNGLREMIDRASQTDAFSSLELEKQASVRALGSSVSRLLGLHARLRQKDGWVWSSRDHDLCLEFLDGLFEGTGRYLFLVRNPLDAADAAARKYQRTGWHATRMIELLATHDDPRLAYVHYWASVFRRARAFRDSHPDRVLVVTYEDLVRETDKTLATVFDFLGHPFSPSLVDAAFSRPREMLEGGWESFAFEGATGVRDDEVDLWHAWDERLVRDLAPVVDDEMAHWGYDPPDR